ncbi:MAG: IS3 family transposase [Clostridia bacterium]|nr:IS3 family transposase [Clostridia bacterium]
MSRAGTPTDNPIIESLNGWIKEEVKIDFNLKDAEDIPSFIENYVHYFNNQRLSYKLNYKTPVQYRIEQGFE